MNTRNMRDVNKLHQSAVTSLAPRLPALSINKLTQGQLKAVVPGLLQLATGSEVGKETAKTSDWCYPSVMYQQTSSKENITTDLLRRMVRNCYRHLGQEDMLTGNVETSWQTALARLAELQSSSIGMKRGPKNCLEFLPDFVAGQSQIKAFIEIYVCFFCSEEFGAKDELRLHQEKCSFRPPELKSVKSPEKCSPHSTGSNNSCPCLSPLWSAVEEKNIPYSRDDYMQGLDLVPVLKAQKIRENRRRTTEVELDVDKFIEPETPKSPGTPRTPKSLISQLSRDGDSSACKRRLSYLCPRDNSDADSVVSSSDEHDELQKPSKTLSLLFIDISSPLGQKVQHCLNVDSATIKVLSNPESYCKTPVKDSTFSEKLRARNSVIPISYKLTRKRLRQFNHMYKFTKSQHEESYEHLRTGLNKGSRILKKSIPKCKLVIRRLTAQDFKTWKANPNPPKVPLNWKSLSRKFASLQKRPVPTQCSFPRGPPVLLTQGIDRLLGLRKKESLRSTRKNTLTLTNVLSEDANADIDKLKLSLYTSLLTELSVTQAKHGLASSPIKDQLKQNAAPVFLSPCLVKIKPIGFNSHPRSLPSSPLSPPASTQSANTKSAVTSPLSIQIPGNTFKFANFLSPARRNKGDMMNDLDSLTSDDSISIRTGSSDESYRCLSPEEEPCLTCDRYLCNCKTKGKDAKDEKSHLSDIINSAPNSVIDVESPQLKRRIGRPKKSVLSIRKHHNLSKNKEECSRQIVRKYRKCFATPKRLNYSLRGISAPLPKTNVPRKLQIDMVVSTFTPAAMSTNSVNVPKNLQIDMVWKPAHGNTSLRVDNKKPSDLKKVSQIMEKEAISKPSTRFLKKPSTIEVDKDFEVILKTSTPIGKSSPESTNVIKTLTNKSFLKSTNVVKTTSPISKGSSEGNQKLTSIMKTPLPLSEDTNKTVPEDIKDPSHLISGEGSKITPKLVKNPSVIPIGKVADETSQNHLKLIKLSTVGKETGEINHTHVTAASTSQVIKESSEASEPHPKMVKLISLLNTKILEATAEQSKTFIRKSKDTTEKSKTPLFVNSSENLMFFVQSPVSVIPEKSKIRIKKISENSPTTMTKSKGLAEKSKIDKKTRKLLKPKKLKIPKGLEIDMVWQPEDMPGTRKSKFLEAARTSGLSTDTENKQIPSTSLPAKNAIKKLKIPCTPPRNRSMSFSSNVSSSPDEISFKDFPIKRQKSLTISQSSSSSSHEDFRPSNLFPEISSIPSTPKIPNKPAQSSPMKSATPNVNDNVNPCPKFSKNSPSKHSLVKTSSSQTPINKTPTKKQSCSLEKLKKETDSSTITSPKKKAESPKKISVDCTIVRQNSNKCSVDSILTKRQPSSPQKYSQDTWLTNQTTFSKKPILENVLKTQCISLKNISPKKDVTSVSMKKYVSSLKKVDRSVIHSSSKKKSVDRVSESQPSSPKKVCVNTTPKKQVNSSKKVSEATSPSKSKQNSLRKISNSPGSTNSTSKVSVDSALKKLPGSLIAYSPKKSDKSLPKYSEKETWCPHLIKTQLSKSKNTNRLSLNKFKSKQLKTSTTSPKKFLSKKQSLGSNSSTSFKNPFKCSSNKKNDHRENITAASLVAGARGIKRKISLGKNVAPKAKKVKVTNLKK